MPSTAGRVRRPAGNRLDVNRSLHDHAIWRNIDPSNAHSQHAPHNHASAAATLAATFSANNYRLVGDDDDDAQQRGVWRGKHALKGLKDFGTLSGESKAEHAPADESDDDDDDDEHGPAAAAAAPSLRKRMREQSSHREGIHRREKKHRKDKRERKKHKRERRSHGSTSVS